MLVSDCEKVRFIAASTLADAGSTRGESIVSLVFRHHLSSLSEMRNSAPPVWSLLYR
jgi:hypothetical protein